MNSLHRLAAAAFSLAVLTATASAKIERVVEKSFQVEPGVNLKVTTSGGVIKVESSSDNVVKVTAREHIRASSDAEADEALKKLDLSIEQSGNEVVAKASYQSGTGFHFGSWPPVQVDFIVSVPASASAELKTSGGDIIVANLGGTLKARTSGGNVKMGDITGEIDASTSGGNVELAQGHARTRLSTSGGNVTADLIVGPADVHTSGGDIRIGSVENVLDADTSGGNVKVSFEGPLKGDCSLSTSGGEVRARVGKGVGFDLDASTSGGGVDASGLTITISHGGAGKSSLAGSVNGGGPLLRLRSSGGDIRISTG